MSQALAFANGWNLAITLWSASSSFMLTLATSASCWPPNMTAIPPPSSTNSTPSSDEGAHPHASWTAQGQRDFRSRWRLFAAILTVAPWWWWKARPSDLYLTEYTAMIIFGPLLVIVGIG